MLFSKKYIFLTTFFALSVCSISTVYGWNYRVVNDTDQDLHIRLKTSRQKAYARVINAGTSYKFTTQLNCLNKIEAALNNDRKRIIASQTYDFPQCKNVSFTVKKTKNQITGQDLFKIAVD
jgi:hypothetical protein